MSKKKLAMRSIEVIRRASFYFHFLIVYYNVKNTKTRTCTVYENSVKLGAMCHESIKGGGKYMAGRDLPYRSVGNATYEEPAFACG